MKITQTPQENHQVELMVEIEAEQMEAAKRRAARKIAERSKVPGFRPGKAPYEVVRRYYGEEAIFEQAIDLLVDEIYPQALKQEGIEPGAPGSLEKIESVDPLRLVFRVPLRPTAELGDYKSLRQAYEFTAPGDDELEQNIQALRQMYGTTQAVERPIQVEDFVLIDLVGKKVKPKEGEEAVVVERKGHAVYVAKEPRDNEYPYKGFAHELIGLKADDKKTITHKFGKDVEDEALRGATVEYEVTVKAVRGLQLPELDDEFARMTGLADTLAELRQNLRQHLEQKAKDDYDDQYFSDLLEKIRAQAVIKYSPQSVEMEVEEMLEDLKENLADRGLDFETFLKIRKVDEEKFIETEVRPAAVRRLERRLIIDALMEAEKVELDSDVLHSEFNQTWNELVQNNRAFNKATKGGENWPSNLVQAVMLDVTSRLLVQNTLERIKSIASGQADDEGKLKSSKRVAAKTESAVGEADAAGTEASGGSSDEPVEAKPKKRSTARKSE